MQRSMELLQATEEQKRERDQVTFAAWGASLTQAQYFERERRLRVHPWARETMRTWLLCGEGGEVLSSCETFRMRAFHRLAGGVLPVGVYAVASVYTEPPLRGRGHAARLLELIHRRLGEEDPAARAVVLFSDVGASIYGRVGYVARPAEDWAFDPEPGDPADGVDGLISERELSEALAAIPRAAEPIVIWPGAGQVDWHIERERVYADLLVRPRPPGIGARAGRSLILWSCARGNLYVLLHHAAEPRESSALLRAARRAAAVAGMSSVRLWDGALPFAGPRPEDGGRREPRKDSLPMIHPLDPGVRPEDWRAITRAVWV